MNEIKWKNGREEKRINETSLANLFRILTPGNDFTGVHFTVFLFITEHVHSRRKGVLSFLAAI